MIDARSPETIWSIQTARRRRVSRGVSYWVSLVQAARSPGSPTRLAIAAVPDAARLLTPRQCEVARLVVAGLSNQEIASRLTIAVGTAANHVEHIRGRLEVHTRLEIATWFLTHFPGPQLPAEPPTSVAAANRRRPAEWQEVHASVRRKDGLVARSSRLIVEAGQRMQNPSPKTRDILRKAYRNVLTALEADHADSDSSRTDQQAP